MRQKYEVVSVKRPLVLCVVVVVVVVVRPPSDVFSVRVVLATASSSTASFAPLSPPGESSHNFAQARDDQATCLKLTLTTNSNNN